MVCASNIKLNGPLTVLERALQLVLLAASVQDQVAVSCDDHLGLPEEEVDVVYHIVGLEFDVLARSDVLDAGRTYHECFSHTVLIAEDEVDLLLYVSWLLKGQLFYLVAI